MKDFPRMLLIICAVLILVGFVGGIVVRHHDIQRLERNHAAICLLAQQAGNQAAFKAAHCP